MSATLLILGGTAEARALAELVVGQAEIRTVSSLAGRVSNPALPVGEVRVGGFGGPEGLQKWLIDEAVTAVVDATHPFAEVITSNAAQACSAAEVPFVRLARPAWLERPGDRWRRVQGLHAAAVLVQQLSRRPMLTTGRQGLNAFSGLQVEHCLIRCVEPPDIPLPLCAELILDRGPYTLVGELALMRDHQIDCLVTKDSGGDLTVAKLDAARELGLPVVLVERPDRGQSPCVATVEDARDWVLAQLG